MNLINISLLIFIQLFSLGNSNPNRNQVDKLGQQLVYRDKITLSGFSSGGTFAQMLQFAFSSQFSGIAVFSHTFYRCGPPDGIQMTYDRVCTKLANLTENEFYNPSLVHTDIQNYFRRGIIENPDNLRGKRLYVYTGLRNPLFTPRQSLGIVTVYERYLGLANIFTRVQDASLVLPTDSRNYGAPCTDLSESTFFIGQCGYSGVTEALNFLLFDNLYSRQDAFGRHNTPRGKVSMFDQTEFTRDLPRHQMDTVGYYYIPRRCLNGDRTGTRCYLHFYFHGCLSGREFANATHIENTGLLEAADRKGIIMIFPQAKASMPENDIGCWDTFGISGEFYATQNGPQITAVKRMLDKILGRRTVPATTWTPSNSQLNNGGVKWPNYGNGKWQQHRPSYYNRNGYSLSRKQQRN